ncbi:sugar phosphate isomerase/epimerase family protein [Halomonas sp. 328]|uniref:sugar phosphate isomerase/epimerase family protein n=1 Tax=Halomonas sp. 328 TaxID=2776704 RepID=UPI0018A7AE14|nr:sugar phosphate isomerase/epimerase [Halomonas sp. 328]MBF8222880.1 sugar phosphate isomerase/epimerase [Halomonas sp. 328]
MIRLHLCTISFRHHLVSLPELAAWAADTGFDGIELWGVHARHLGDAPGNEAAALRHHGLVIPMLSDYLPLEGDEAAALAHTRRLCRLARYWGADKLRTFAGHRPSAALDRSERRALAQRLRRLTECVAEAGQTLVVETHPNTLADHPEATRALLDDVDHPGLGLNFDVLHVWEAGVEPLAALRELAPWVRHFHLKNIDRHERLSVFAPANVYSPAGSRDGMVPVLEGACDYGPVLDWLARRREPMDVSLEWFGPDGYRVLAEDLTRVRQRLSASSPALAALA